MAIGHESVQYIGLESLAMRTIRHPQYQNAMQLKQPDGYRQPAAQLRTRKTPKRVQLWLAETRRCADVRHLIQDCFFGGYGRSPSNISDFSESGLDASVVSVYSDRLSITCA